MALTNLTHLTHFLNLAQTSLTHQLLSYLINLTHFTYVVLTYFASLVLILPGFHLLNYLVLINLTYLAFICPAHLALTLHSYFTYLTLT